MNKFMLAPLAVGGFLLIAAHGNASALTRGETAEGLGYATGGVTVSELKTLAAEKDHYDLWVTTAAKGSGAFLSDVQLKITDKQRHVVLDTTMIGPWLFVDLAPGTYTIEAKFKDQSLKRTTWVGRGDHHQAILYFDSPARVSPDWVSPFARSPYAAN